MLFILFKSLDNRILDIRISKESKNALLIYLFLEKFISIAPSTLTLSIMKAFSSEKLFENEISENIVAVKMIKIYSLNLAIKYLDIKKNSS